MKKCKMTVFFCFIACVFTACREKPEEPPPEVESLQFINQNVTMKVGERLAVKIDVKPTEARRYAGVSYTPSVEGYISVGESSNDGCVITAEKGGTVVLVARAGSYTAYLEVKILGDQFIQEPFIMVPTQVIEVMEGARKTAQVSLYNGSAVDQQLFQWGVEPGKDNISINPTGNTVVVQGEKRGSQKITIKHDKSAYDAEILVFVVGSNESVKYITTRQNVITMSAGGVSHELTVNLAGGSPTDIAGFTFSTLEEYPCIGLLPSNNSCNIVAYRKGTSVININHPLAEYDLQVRVIAAEGQESYIEIEPTFKILDIGQNITINGNLNGYYIESWKNDWQFTKKGDVDCINVTQAGSQFFVQAKEIGRCVLEIRNTSMPSYPREALIVVRDSTMMSPDEWYITTSQNVIQMEVGQRTAAQLSIQLINGNEADKNNFSWTVEDSSVITVEPQDTSSVNYLRGMKNRAQAEIKSVTNTIALITPKKVGTTKIIIEIEKGGKNLTANVIVKVYPLGTFGSSLYILDRKEGGLIKVDTALQAQSGKDTPVNLYIAKPDSGDVYGLGKLKWEIQNNVQNYPEIAASVQDTHGLDNEVHGRTKGINKLVVSNAGDVVSLKYPFEAAVMVGTTEQLASMAVFFVDKAYQTVAAGHNAYVQILNSNMTPIMNNNGEITGYSPDPAKICESDRYYARDYNRSVVNAVMVKNRLMLQGVGEGLTTVTIGNDAFPDVAPVEVKVTVLPGLTTIDKPYMLTSNANFIGMVWGTQKEYEVRLAGEENLASAVEEDKIYWTTSNGYFVNLPIHPYGKKVLLKAGNGTWPDNDKDKTGQANITASHARSVNEKVTVVYVVPTEADLGKVALGIEKQNWLLKPGEEVMINLITNADDTPSRDINKIKWYNRNDVDYTAGSDPVIDLEYNGPNAKVTAKPGAQGSTVVTVRHPNMVMELKIFISVSSMQPLSKTITLPTIVEMIVNENKVVTALTEGLEQQEINKIEWVIEDESIAAISTDLPLGGDGKFKGGKLYLKGKKKGQTWITAGQSDLGYIKKILLVCANGYEELANTYVMACEESYFRMKKGDVRAITLVYGQAGFPENKKAEITWEDMDKNNVIKIHPPQLGYAEIEAVNEGVGRVKVNHKDVFKPVELTFEVSKDLIPGQSYEFTYSGMMGLVVWTSKDDNGVTLDNSYETKEPYTKTTTLGITPSGLSFSAIKWSDDEKPNAGIVSVAASGLGNTYMVTGRKEGQTYLRFHHESGLVPDDARILVYTAKSVKELQAMFPIAISRTNYLLNKGDPAEVIRITVPSRESMGLSEDAYRSKLEQISFDTGVTSGGYVADFMVNTTRTDVTKFMQEVTVTPKGAGTAFIDVKYGPASNQKLIDRVYLSVREKAYDATNKRVLTESIIGLTSATVKRKTTIGTNLTSDEKADLRWESLDPSIVFIEPVPGDYTSCYLTGKKEGNTEVVISYGDTAVKRYIKVYVTADPEQYKEVNLDNRYYTLRKNDVLPITAFHAALPAVGDDKWSIPFDNNVAQLRKIKDSSGAIVKDRVEIVGMNEGLAEIVLENDECHSDVKFIVEVNNTAPLVETLIDDWYLTAARTVYAIDPDKTNDITRIQIDGVRFTQEEISKIRWSIVSEAIGEGGNAVIHVMENEPGYKPVLLTMNNKNGGFIDVMPNKKTGSVVLRASHARSVNDMDITVICDTKAVLTNPVPRLETDKETVKLQLNEDAEVNVFIRDMDGGYDIGQFVAVSDNPQRVSVNTVGNKLQIKGVNFGQALISITHPKVQGFVKKIIVIVLSGDTSLVYLTTKQNFVQIEKGGFTAVEVELVGYNDLQSRNYIWSTDDGDIVSINDSGKTAVITAKNTAKTAKIMVQHTACLEYPLYIYVRVTEKNTANPTYITTPNNIVSIKEGAGIQVKANLVNGGGQELSLFTWSTANNNLIELNYAGDSALIKGISPGTAQVQIWHPSSLNTISMLVVVEPLEPNNGIYISTDNQLVEMTTRETQRLIKVRLIGGEPEDVYGFQWQITRFSSIEQVNGMSLQPITILTNADNCYIQPVTQKYEGEAIITVSHPKTSYKLEIKVIIADATEIKFAQAYLTINQFAQQMVGITAPANGALNLTVQQNAQDPVISAYATNTMCVIEGIKAGTAIVRLTNATGTKSDELVVRVNPIDLTNYAYITIPGNTLITDTLTNAKTIEVQIKGAKSETDEEKMMNALACKISSENIIGIGKDWGKKWVGNGADKRFTWTLDISMKGIGSAELMFSIPDKNNVNADINQDIFKTYPALKGSLKKVYFKVQEGDNVFGVDRSDIQMYQGAVGEMIIATVDTPRSGGIQASDIRWEIKNPAGVEKNCITLDFTKGANNELGTNTVLVNAEEVGSCWIEVHYSYKATKVITVRVNPVEFLTANPSSFTLGPGVDYPILVNSNPNNKDITIEFDSNVGVETSIWGKPNDGKPEGEGYSLLQGNAFRTGEKGYYIRVRGSSLQGVVRLNLKMQGANRQTVITITNVKNYYARWTTAQSLRFRPDTPESSPDVKVYYECNPAADYLELDTDPVNFSQFFDLDGLINTKEKYVHLKRPAAHKGWYASGAYNGSDGIKPSIRFITHESKQQISLPVFIYWDKIDVTWEIDRSDNNAAHRFNDLRYQFDSVTYALKVPYTAMVGGRQNALRINLKVPEWNPAMIQSVKISNITANPDTQSLLNEYKEGVFSVGRGEDADGKQYFYIYRNGLPNQNETIQPGSAASVPNQSGVTYCGVLDVQYQYNNGGAADAVFNRKFLVYAVHY